MKRWILVAIALPAIVFIVQNAQITELRFLVWRLAIPHALLLAAVLGVGVLAGWLLHAVVAGRRASR